MKKFYYIVGAFVTAAAVFAFIAVMLKKLKISLSIEGIDDEILDEPENSDIELTIDADKKDTSNEADEEYLKKELDSLISDEDEPLDIDVEIKDDSKED